MPFFILLLSVQFLQAQTTDSAIKNTAKKRILILNAFDGTVTRHSNVTYAYEGSKKETGEKEFFQVLADSLKQILATGIKTNYRLEPEVIDNIPQSTADADSAIHALLKTKNASSAIVIRELSVYFPQTKVDVQKNRDGSKNRTASYDICSFARYSFYTTENNNRNSEIEKCEYFSQREVISGLFAVGPRVLKKKKDAFKQISKNADGYLMEIRNELK